MKTQDEQDEELKQVSNFKSKSEKLSWTRKQAKIKKIIEEKLKPIQDEILKLTLEKQPIMDEIDAIRSEMVKTCIHPKDYLEHKGDHIECKFCYNKIHVSRKQ